MKRKIIILLVCISSLLSVFALSCSAITFPDGRTPLPTVLFRQYESTGGVKYVQTPAYVSLSQIGQNTVTTIPSGSQFPQQNIRAGFQGDGRYVWMISENFQNPANYPNYNRFEFTVTFPSGSNNYPFYVFWSSRYWSDSDQRYYNIRPEVLTITRIMYNPSTDEYWTYTVDYESEYNPTIPREILVSEANPSYTCLGLVATFEAPPYTPTGVVVESTFGMACDMSQGYSGNNPDFIRSDSYDTGYSEGDEVGYDRGYDTGYSEGDEVGYDRGYDNGYAYGYDDGRDVGYEEGTDIRDRGLLGWIADSVSSFLSAEIAPNFSLGGLLAMIFGAFALLWILKLIAGG